MYISSGLVVVNTKNGFSRSCKETEESTGIGLHIERKMHFYKLLMWMFGAHFFTTKAFLCPFWGFLEGFIFFAI